MSISPTRSSECSSPRPNIKETPTKPVLSVGIVTNSVSRNAGGLFNSVRSSALALSRIGPKINVFAIDDEHTTTDYQAWSPLTPSTFSPAGPRALGLSPSLGRALAISELDIIHQHGIWQFLSRDVRNLRRRKGIPVIISPRGMLDAWALANSSWKKRAAAAFFERSNLQSAACLHALNHCEAEAIRAFGLQNPIAIIPNGVDLPDQRLALCRPQWLRDDGRRTMLFLGRLHPKKGISELISAWAHLKHDGSPVAADWRLVIAGWDDGNHLEALRSQANSLHLAEDVIFPGALFGDDKAGAFAHADAFVLPSYSEGLPMAVLEAWSYGLPVFMTRACNILEGFKCDAALEITTAPDAIASVFSRQLLRPDLADIGGRGQILAADRFAWPAIAQAFLEVYIWMVNGGPRPSVVETI